MLINGNEIIQQTQRRLSNDEAEISLINSEAYERLSKELDSDQKDFMLQILAECLDEFMQRLMQLFDNNTEFSERFMIDILNEDKGGSINDRDETYLDVYSELSDNEDIENYLR